MARTAKPTINTSRPVKGKKITPRSKYNFVTYHFSIFAIIYAHVTLHVQYISEDLSKLQQPRKRKYRPGTVALWKIHKFQKCTELLI